MKQKRRTVVIILLVIACLFVIGADWANETIHRFFHSYFADIAIPFGYYFLLFLLEDRYNLLRKWYLKAVLVFALCSVSETLQFFGIYALASVFDPWDYGMYALGLVLAAILDRQFFKRWFSFW
ncbi:MAG: hypothetical protein HYZ15_11020 [Sphingobacteriales bacterium]|nr:hypothetical protein [Sphingobacteriales bacterium]